MGNSQPVDREALRNLLNMFNGDTAFLGQVIDTYLSDAANLFASLHQAMASGNADELRRAAHSLKSNSANLGAAALSSLSKEIEDIGKRGTVDGAAQKLPALEAEYARVQAALEVVRANGL